MGIGNLEVAEMQSPRQFSRFSTLNTKSQILKKLGRNKGETYFKYLRKFLANQLTKLEFDKLCYSTIGKENIALHNLFIRSILKNAHLSNVPPDKRTSTVHSRDSTITNGYLGETMLTSPRKEKSVNSRFHKARDRPSLLGPYGKVPNDKTNSCDLQRPHEFVSIGSKALGSVEDGEEVEQVRSSPGVQSRSPVVQSRSPVVQIRSPIKAPLGISIGRAGFTHNHLGAYFKAGFHHKMPSSVQTSCKQLSELPDRDALRKQLEYKLEAEGLTTSVEFLDLLNKGLDAHIKRLLKPCLDLAKAKHNTETVTAVNWKVSHDTSGVRNKEYLKKSSQYCLASLLDFRVAMESNCQLLGKNWPVQLEKLHLHEHEYLSSSSGHPFS